MDFFPELCNSKLAFATHSMLEMIHQMNHREMYKVMCRTKNGNQVMNPY